MFCLFTQSFLLYLFLQDNEIILERHKDGDNRIRIPHTETDTQPALS
ncbi:hypothetical protein CLOSTHATH_03780 [Hungatella hathewayi DSM 13479]|uniref:Uncharacterized protein n=1 Tax=Hungatella hathewayi DSM 13479 TaxID=566550 RepID=D3AJI9_9FIRM|nr:hypothetical protein CLOSTHATH_03780 [Hungatella hathewayi DSM 13479]